MDQLRPHRRKVLTAAASCAIAGIAGANPASGADVSRRSFAILPGTERETTVYETTASADGPTVIVVGGVHGNEQAGYEAAGQISEWTIEAGTLVTIPRANELAIQRGARSDGEIGDLNRQFDEGEQPESDLAAAIWDVVVDYDPDVVIDLHESTGIYAGDPVDGVGQAIFSSDHAEANADANRAINHLNREHVEASSRQFLTGPFSGPQSEPRGLLVHKVARDLDARSFLVETLSRGVDLDTRILWHTHAVEELIREELFPEEGQIEDPDAEESDDGEPGLNQADDEEEESDEGTDDSGDEEPAEDSSAEEELDDRGSEEEPDEGSDDSDDDSDDSDDDDSDDSDDDDSDDSDDDTEEPDETDEDEDDGSEDESETEDPDEDDEDEAVSQKPVAKIETCPRNADELSLEIGQTVELDASASHAPDGEIVCYEWSVDGDGNYDERGETVDLTIGANAEHPVVLRVTDDSGRSALAEIVLTAE